MVTANIGLRTASLTTPNIQTRALRDLVSYWPCRETATAAVLQDVYGQNSLADSGSVTSGVGPGGNLRTARQFTIASSQRSSLVDNASLSMGAGVYMACCAWVNLDATATIQTILSKFDAVNQCEYDLQYNSGTTRFEFVVDADGALAGAATATADNLGAPSAATWYFVSAWYDRLNIYISVNGGNPNTTSYSTDIFNGTATFAIGAAMAAAPTNFMGGRIAGVGLWKYSGVHIPSVGGVGVADPAVRAWLYNNGPAGARGWPFRRGVG